MARRSSVRSRFGAALGAALIVLAMVPAGAAFGFGSSEDFPGVPEVNAGGYMSCGVRADNVAACWGDNVSEGPGQSTPPAGVAFIEANAGYAHGCGVKTDNTLACWGASGSGRTTPPSGTFIHVVAGFEQSCGLATDRTIACWGRNDTGSTVPPAGQFKQMSIGIRYGCGLRDSGAVECWGSNTYGQLNVPSGLVATSITTGNFTTCAIKASDSTVVCWGRDTGLQVTNVPAGAFATVNAGFAHVCGLRPDQTITCWGSNSFGQLTGIPTGTFKQVSAGTFHSCALRTNNVVICWGQNAAGRVTPDIRNFPQNGTVASPYTFQFASYYLSPAGTYSLAPGSGPLPTGLVLNPNGTITGTPTVAGTYPNIVVQMTNGLSPVVSATVSMTIDPFVPQPPTQTITGDFTGPVTVGAGQSVLISNARVTGPVTVTAGGTLSVANSSVSQGITADAPAFLTVCGSSVSGPSTVPGQGVVVRNATGPVIIGDPANGCALNRIAGDLTADGNKISVTIGGNTVSGTATVINNVGSAPVVKANTIFKVLACSGNTPAPTNAGQANTAPSKTGQCAAL